VPRFAGKKAVPLWWEIVALAVLAVVLLVVLSITGVIHLFGS
jgi:hypothetical protein